METVENLRFDRSRSDFSTPKKIILQLEILFGEVSESGNLSWNSFKGIVFKTAAGGIKLSNSCFNAEYTVTVCRYHTVLAKSARRRDVAVIEKLFSHNVHPF